MKSYNDEYEEREDLEKSLDGIGIEYLHCSTCAYIYVEGKMVYDVSKSDMMPSGDCEIFFPLNQVAIMSEKRWCDTRWFANKLAQSMKFWKIDDMSRCQS